MLESVPTGEPKAPEPDRVAHFTCEGGCSRRFRMEGYGVDTLDGGRLPPMLDLKIVGHIEPPPQGCLVPLGLNWLMYWMWTPTVVDPTAAPNPNAIALRKQVYGPMVICRECLSMGGMALLPNLVGLMMSKKVKFGPQTLLEIINLITKSARAKRERAARRPK